MTFLRRLLEPKRVLLAWQSSRAGSMRRRWPVAEIVRSQTSAEAPATLSYFRRDRLSGAMAEGFSGYPAFSMKHQTHENVLAIFMLRLPPRRRADFAQYLGAYLIDRTAQFTDFALLAATEARLPSDGFSIVNPLDEVQYGSEFVIEAVGFRHLPPQPRPEIGAPVEFRVEADNAQDPNAIAIFVGQTQVGYINRLQTRAFHRWIADCRVTGRIARLNGTSDRPRVFIWTNVE